MVAENKVLKINPQKNGASVQVFFGYEAGEIIGISASISTSCLLINVKNRGLFAYRLSGQLLWSAGPVLYQHGYRQGCRRNVTDCYFTSVPVIDHCEASIFVSFNHLSSSCLYCLKSSLSCCCRYQTLLGNCIRCLFVALILNGFVILARSEMHIRLLLETTAVYMLPCLKKLLSWHWMFLQEISCGNKVLGL